MEIIGRDTELARLRDTIDRAPGALHRLTLYGDPGTGRSALLDAAVGHARGRGLLVLGNTGYPDESGLSFAGLHQLLAPVLSRLDRVEPFQRATLRSALGLGPGPEPERPAVCVASLALLAVVAGEGPALITPGSGWPSARCCGAATVRPTRGPSCATRPTSSPASVRPTGSGGPNRSCGPRAWPWSARPRPGRAP